MRRDLDFIEKKTWLFGKQLTCCNGCYKPYPFNSFQVDHIIPRVRRGSDDIENLQLLCRSCNATKGDRSQEYLHRSLVYKLAEEKMEILGSVVEELVVNESVPVELAIESAIELAMALAEEELAERALWVEEKKELVPYYLNN